MAYSLKELLTVDQLTKSSQTIFLDSGKSISLPELAAGQERLSLQDLPGKPGQVVAPVSPLVAPERDSERKTSGICGRNSGDSLTSADLQLCLESRLRQRLEGLGSQEYVLTWKQWAMQSGPPICALRASGHRTSGSDCTGEPSGWKSPVGSDGEGGVMEYHHGADARYKLRDMAGWVSPTAQDHSRGIQPPRRHDTGIPLSQQVAGLTGWPTPIERDRRMMNKPRSDGRQDQLPNVTAGLTPPQSSAETAKSEGYRLNPAFSAWLMGYPLEWTASGHNALSALIRSRRAMRGKDRGSDCSRVTETQLCQNSRQNLLKPLYTVSKEGNANMTVTKRARKPKGEVNAAANLLAALKFIAPAQSKEGMIYQTFSQIKNNTITAFDGKLAIGCKIEEDLTACPHTLQFIEALSRCGSELAINQLDAGRLSIKSGPFRAFVPCAADDDLIPVEPDPGLYSLDTRLTAALETVFPLADQKEHDIWASSVLIQSGSATASDGKILFQYWHGIEMPTCVLPKDSVAAIVKAKKPPVKFGYSGKTLTIWFEDDSWIKTQLYDEEWPDLAELIDVPCNPWPVPDNFFKAVEAVAPFNKDGSVHFIPGAVCSEHSDEIGTKYDVIGLPPGKIFGAKYLLMLRDKATHIDFNVENRAMFFGDNLRGLIMGRVI
jgi:hypothetical protein